MSEWFGRMPSRTRRTIIFGGLGLLLLVLLVASTRSRPGDAPNASALALTGQKHAGFSYAGTGARASVVAQGREAASASPAGRIPASGFEGEVVPAGAAAAIPWSDSAMLVRTASLRVRVSDVAQAYASVVAIAQGAGGYLASSTMSAESRDSSATVVVRVPNRGLDSALERIAGLGKLLSRQVQSQEVTEEYVDLSSRLRNLQREELRLLDFMTRAGKIPDLLMVEQEVARVRGEIETVSGRLRYLDNRVSLSTLEVTLMGPHAKASPAGGRRWSGLEVAKEAYGSLRDTAHGLATAGIWLGMYLPIWFPSALGVTWVVRRELHRPS